MKEEETLAELLVEKELKPLKKRYAKEKAEAIMVRLPHILKFLKLFTDRQGWKPWVKKSSGFNYSNILN